MKKYIQLILIFLFIFTLASCTNDEPDSPKPTPKPDNYYEIYFMVDNENYKTVKVLENTKVEKPTDPTKENFDFIEWQLNGKKFNFDTLINDNYYIDAYFIEKTKHHELFLDPKFEHGFNLIYPDTRTPDVVRILTTTVKDPEPKWQMGQWWTKYDMQYATYREENGYHIYENESHVVKINPQNGSLYTKLLASLEYDKPRLNGENWPHILIEQSLPKLGHEAVHINDLDKVIVSMDINIIRCDNMMKESEYSADRHAAQLLWYFTLANQLPEGASPEEYGNNGEFMWFGVPIFDSRYPNGIPVSKQIDKGFVGASNKLIYSISSRDYIEHPIKFGETFHVEVDILPYLIEAWVYGQQNGALVNCVWENMVLGYMNFGWELPGTFDVESEISNMSVQVYYE